MCLFSASLAPPPPRHPHHLGQTWTCCPRRSQPPPPRASAPSIARAMRISSTCFVLRSLSAIQGARRRFGMRIVLAAGGAGYAIKITLLSLAWVSMRWSLSRMTAGSSAPSVNLSFNPPLPLFLPLFLHLRCRHVLFLWRWRILKRACRRRC